VVILVRWNGSQNLKLRPSSAEYPEDMGHI
jgi:hypothetical protein